MKQVTKELEFGGRKLTISTGKLAGLATGAVLATYGETVVLATAVSSPLAQDLGYFPLTVEYMEKLYAGGRIKGSRWVKREGRPTDDEILTARLIDRSIRPLFPKAFKKEVQVIITVLSVDMENDPDFVAGVAVAAALSASSIPWDGPSALVRVGKKNGDYFVNPREAEKAYSEMDLVVTATDKAVVMIEAGAKEVTEEAIIGGVEFAQKEAAKLITFISEFAKEVGIEKEALPKEEKNESLAKKVKELAGEKIKAAIANVESESPAGLEELKSAVAANFEGKEAGQAAGLVEELFKKEVRAMILAGKRPDGRKHTEIRPLSAEVGTLPRTHGSAIFQRGQTQVLSITTLGTSSLGQLIETALGEEEKRYIHHYAMPPFSLGETGRVGSPSRREIGHGALAERALEPVIPSEEEFPYAVRVVSEVLSSNGSTSMASTCGSTLSLMDAGVPIKAPVAGIAMGLVIEDAKNYAVLTDIIGLEDFNGDMDFKVAGTAKGITALQLDVKTLALTSKILKDALAQAHAAREKIMEVMLSAISTPRGTVSVHAPKIKMVKIPVDKIGELIGPGGKMIKRLMADTGTMIDVEDDGSVSISAPASEAVEKAVAMIEGMSKEVTPGEIYEGIVKRVQPFGAFIEILPGKEGMVHVSDMAEDYVADANDKVKVGDKVQVRVKEIDELKRLNLSMILDPTKEKPKTERRAPARGGYGRSEGRGFGGGDRGPARDFAPRGRQSFGRDGGRGFDRDRRDDRRGPRREGGFGSSGPHFPTSRYVDSRKKSFGR